MIWLSGFFMLALLTASLFVLAPARDRAGPPGDPALSIGGSVLDVGGEPLPGIRVTATPLAAADSGLVRSISATTNSRGTFTLAPLTEGEFELEARGETYEPVRVRVRAGTAAVVIRLQRPRAMRGGAVDVRQAGLVGNHPARSASATTWAIRRWSRKFPKSGNSGQKATSGR